MIKTKESRFFMHDCTVYSQVNFSSVWAYVPVSFSVSCSTEETPKNTSWKAKELTARQNGLCLPTHIPSFLFFLEKQCFCVPAFDMCLNLIVI